MRLLFVDRTPGFTPDRRDNKPCGGILNSLTLIPRYLARLGHEVYVSSSFDQNIEIEGVHYVRDGEAVPKWDVSILNRNGVYNQIVDYSRSIGAKVLWWLHDVVDFRYLDDGGFKKVDKILALSEYCKDVYSKFYDIPEEKFAVIPNGVDKTLFYPGDYNKRKKHKLIMASALIKGFMPIEQTWNNYRRHFPEAELVIYSNQSLHEFENSAVQQHFLDTMETLKARVCQPVPQAVLAEIMRDSWMLLMPNSYPEICSNLMLQAQASGLPVVSSCLGSAAEFIKNGETGIVTPGYPHDTHLWIKQYAEATIDLGKDELLHQKISENSGISVPTWDDIGERWNAVLKELVSKN